MNSPRTVPVWSAAIRAGHWALAACVLASLWLYEGGAWHERLGYAALALATWRVVLGLTTRTLHLRFANFVNGPTATLSYLRALVMRREPRHLGHNPLGGWMIVLLLAAAVLAGGSGALYNADRFWGDEVVYTVHRIAGWAFVVLVPLHVLGVIVTSLLQRENLVLAMFSGRKRKAAPGDINIT